jgi:hypothetical protein
MRISRQRSPVQIIILLKQVENIEHLNYLSNMKTNAARCTHEIKLKIAIAKEAFIKKTLFASKLDLNLRKKPTKSTFATQLCMKLTLGHFGKQIRSNWKVLKRGAGEEWRRSFGPIV